MKEKVMAAALGLALLGSAGYAAVTSHDAFGMRSDDHVGIPDDNPSHHPEDGDGECEKGETVIKTTPSGKRVNVPCQAAEHGHGGDDGQDAADDSSGGGNGHGKNKGKD